MLDMLFYLGFICKARFSFCSSLSVCPISTMLPGQKGIKDRSSQKKKRVSTCGKTSSFHKKMLYHFILLNLKTELWNRVQYVCFFTIWNWWWSKWFLGVSYQSNSSQSRYGTLCGFFCSYLSPIFSDWTRGLTIWFYEKSTMGSHLIFILFLESFRGNCY